MSAKKIKRKDLLNTQDEFLTLSEKAYIYIVDHKKQFITAGVVIVLVFLIGLGTTFYINSQRRQAQAAFNQATSQLPAENDPSQADLKKAVESFNSYLQEYQSSKPAHYARLELADLYYRLGDYSNAEAAYGNFLSNKESVDNNLKPFVLDAEATTLEMKGEFDKAIADWQKVLAMPGSTVKPEALLGIARAQESLKNTAEARKAYEKLIAEYPDSGKVTIAKARLNSLPK